jgi:hypothetical protein
MRLFKLENYENGVWYFTDTAKAAKYINTTQSYLDLCRKKTGMCKGWSIEEVYDDNVLSKFINPKRNNYETQQ